MNLFIPAQGRMDDLAKLKESIFSDGEGKQEMDEELVE